MPPPTRPTCSPVARRRRGPDLRRLRRGLGVLLCLGALWIGSPPAQGGPASGHLDLVVEPGEVDFGVVGQNEVLRATLTYTNRSAANVEGISARAECGCNVVDVSHAVLAPGESGSLTVEFHTFNLSGTLRKDVKLTSGDYKRGEAVVPLRIQIQKGLIVNPAAVSFRDVPLGTTPTAGFNVKWMDGFGTPFEIRAVEVPGDDFHVQIAPMADASEPRWKGWRVDLTFKAPPPLGMYSAEVLVKTTHPEHPLLSLPLSANVTGKIWVQSRTLTFGAFRRGEPRTASIRLRPFDTSITLKDLTARALKGRIEVRIEPDPVHGEDGVWRLTGSVPGNVAAGSLDDEVIEVHTGVPGEETIRIQIKGHVLQGAQDGR